MVDTINQSLLFLLGIGGFVFAIIFFKQNKESIGLYLLPYSIIVIFLAEGYTTLKSIRITWGNDKKEINLERYPESERNELHNARIATNETVNKTEELNQAIENAKKRGSQERVPEDYLALAIDYWAKNEFDDGLKFAFAGLFLEPKDNATRARLLNMLGVNFSGLKNEDIAIKYYIQATHFDPSFSLPLYNLGVLYDYKNDLENAKLYYEKASNLGDTDARKYLNELLQKKKVLGK